MSEDGFKVYRSADYAFTIEEELTGLSLGVDATSTIFGEDNTKQFYKVAAFSAHGESRTSSEFATTEAFPGYALSFDGVDDYVTINDNSTINTIQNNDFTVEFWTKLDPADINTAMTFIDKVHDASSAIQNGFLIHPVVSSGVVRACVSLGGTTYCYDGATNIFDLEYHHVAIAKTGTTITIYVDGLDDGITSFGNFGTTGASSVDLNNGQRPYSEGTEHLNGEIDDLRIWNDFRTDFSNRFSSVDLSVAQPNLVAYYPFDEGVGLTTIDRSVNTNNGTLINGPTWVKGSIQPTITSISPASAIVGTTITITGTNFNPAGNQVYLGTREVTSTTVSDTQITFALPVSGISYTDISVLSFGKYASSKISANPNLQTTFPNGNVVASTYGRTPLATGDAWNVAVGDFNKDGKMDRARIASSGTTVLVELRNIANTGYDTPIAVTVATSKWLALGDMNADGNLDIVVSRETPSTVNIYYADITGIAFSSSETPGIPSGSAKDINLADLNNDGYLDMLITNHTSIAANIIYRNVMNDDWLTPVPLPGAGGEAYESYMADFNGDGLVDIALGGYDNNAVNIYLRNATNTDFVTPVPLTVATSGIMGLTGGGL